MLRTMFSPMSLAPLIALLAGGLLLAHALFPLGPQLTIDFVSGAGLQAGKTRVRYRNVEVGELETLHLSRDRSHVTAVVRLMADAARLATCGTRFWVARPRIDASGISGLETLRTAPYIDVDIGAARTTCHSFIGLETPPVVSADRRGSRFILRAASLGSLQAGSPVYFHRVAVGQILGYTLPKNGQEVDVDVFVNAPFDRYVTSSTRWWQASGIDVQLDSRGFNVDLQPLEAMLRGGVQFDSPAEAAPPSHDSRTFTLADNRTDALRSTNGPAAPVQMRFRESLRGLVVGAPVDFHGVEIGNVTRIDVDNNTAHGGFDMIVSLNLYPFRLGRRYRAALGKGDGPGGRTLLSDMIAQGLRGQVRMGSVLTGQRYIALDFFPKAPPVHFDAKRAAVELPTVPNTIEELQDLLGDIVAKLDRVPFDEIGRNVDASLDGANTLLKTLNDETVPQTQSTLAFAQTSFAAARATLEADSPLQTDVRTATTQLRRTLASVNALADYLQRHPESIVWGKPSGQ
ncbi:intermembrane transport protein PqiB [Paraburkholderia tropica]|uniref:Paraquat-inducible protein B n=1 Tax=Paraburkholderia tropica TaxID=92647 RepID=A0ABX5MQ63_9BURK|nr:MlaD family protein [Paraburkholderia tropica]PXX16892.1 paraquat-inducible protein B [Paraburkholderia tropica]PZW83965.1 paraquat-inducible protein B [Paraburkholderia tropica]